ncbi:hypothetical protein [Actinokineospora terrae]|uniref:Uncharacterized protein n=1 Tax=Actinokineospora terrae TaxID=155974 RepID=A0A1H9UTF3_9PSEU|nr:hypothetical protein [Actinokineospora terrae]SES12414.1 hypothetical protein SAMN04487818_107451 [Actinokineospora terrae]
MRLILAAVLTLAAAVLSGCADRTPPSAEPRSRIAIPIPPPVHQATEASPLRSPQWMVRAR